jgi:hypothetical protein
VDSVFITSKNPYWGDAMASAFCTTNLRFDYRVHFSSWLHARNYFQVVPEVRNSQQLRRPLKAREVINRFILGSHDICEHLWLWQTGSGLGAEDQRICTIHFLSELLTKVFDEMGDIPEDVKEMLAVFRNFNGKLRGFHIMRETISGWINVCSVHEAANRSDPEEGEYLRVGMLKVPNTLPPKAAATLKRAQSDALHALINIISLSDPCQSNQQYFALRAMENAKDAIHALGKIYPFTIFVRQKIPVVLFIRELSQDWFEAPKPRVLKAEPRVETQVVDEGKEEQQDTVQVSPDRCSADADESKHEVLQQLGMARGLGLLCAVVKRQRAVQ